MPYIAFTAAEIAINAGALALRHHALAHMAPTTYGWLDQYTYKTQGGLGIKPAARLLAPGLPEQLTTDRELVAWTIGALGRRVTGDGQPSEPVPDPAPGSWQERAAHQAAQLLPGKTPALPALVAAWAARPSPKVSVGALCDHLGIDRRHRTNVTNALGGNRDSLPASQRYLLGTYLLP